MAINPDTGLDDGSGDQKSWGGSTGWYANHPDDNGDDQRNVANWNMGPGFQYNPTAGNWTQDAGNNTHNVVYNDPTNTHNVKTTNPDEMGFGKFLGLGAALLGGGALLSGGGVGGLFGGGGGGLGGGGSAGFGGLESLGAQGGALGGDSLATLGGAGSSLGGDAAATTGGATSAMGGGPIGSELGAGYNPVGVGSGASPSSGLGGMFDSAKGFLKSPLFGNGLGITGQQGLSALYDMYAKNQKGNAQMGQFNKVNSQYDNYAAKIDNSYMPGSPEYEMMKQEMERKDAAAGRNSQYGQRGVELQAKIAQIKAQQRAQLMQTQSNSGTQQNALLNQGINNQYGGLNSLFGYLGDNSAFGDVIKKATGSAN